MNNLCSLRLLFLLTVLLIISETQFAQSQFLKTGESANSISVSHTFSPFDLTTVKYTKSFSGKLDTYISLGYASQDLTDFGSPFTFTYYMPGIGADYFLFKKPSTRFSASLGANYTFIKSRANESIGSARGHFSTLKARAFYSIPFKRFQLLPTIEYTHGFNLESPNINNGDINVGLSASMSTKNNQRFILETKYNGIKDRFGAFELSLGYSF